MENGLYTISLSSCFKNHKGNSALEWKGNCIRYRDLEILAQNVALRLKKEGVETGAVVGVCLENPVHLTAVLLGTVLCGGLFCILDRSWPDDKLRETGNRTGMSLVLCEGRFFPVNARKVVVDESFFDNDTVGDVAREAGTGEHLDDFFIHAFSGFDESLQIVTASLPAFSQTIAWEAAKAEIGSDSRVSGMTRPGARGILRPLFKALMKGATVCFPPDGADTETADLMQWAEREKLTVFHLDRERVDDLRELREQGKTYRCPGFVFLEGIGVKPGDIETFYGICRNRARLSVVYGIDEGTVAGTCFMAEPDDARRPRIPVGFPVDGTDAYILDEDMDFCDDEFVGDVFLLSPFRPFCPDGQANCGDSLFIPDSLEDTGGFLYKTGHKGRETGDGGIDITEYAARVVKKKKKARKKVREILPEPVEKKEYYPLSSAQKRLYVLQEIDVESTAYNMPGMAPLPPNPDLDGINRAVMKLFRRQESLRTSFIKVNGEPVQRVHENVEFDILFVELDRNRSLRESIVRPFDLTRAPLMRAAVAKLKGDSGDDQWMFWMDIHHIIADGTSNTILFKDFAAIYSGTSPEPLRIQYKDFSVWQNRLFEGEENKKQEEFWLEVFGGGMPIPLLEMPTDFPRPDTFTFEGHRHYLSVKGNEAEAFGKIAADSGGTLYMAFLAVLNVLFFKYSGQEDIIIGTGVAGRRHSDLEGIIGMFVNTLAMRNYPAGGLRFDLFLDGVVSRSIKAFENQDYPFDMLVEKLALERDKRRNPVFDVCMVVQNFTDLSSRENDGNTERKGRTAKFDLTFFVWESREGIEIAIEYYSRIFKESTIQRLGEHLCKIITEVVRDKQSTLDAIDMIPLEEKELLLNSFNDTGTGCGEQEAIPVLFIRQAEQTPDAVAVIFEDSFFTYRQLNDESDWLAAYLREEKQLQVGEPVGVWLEPSALRPMALLGILKAGGAFVPIDPELPGERVKYVMEDAAIRVMVSGKRFLRDLERLQWESTCLDHFICLDSRDISSEPDTGTSELMDVDLWRHVGKTATDDITGGGWLSSFTGLPFSRLEMDEYGDNILEKLRPLLHKRMRVLEIGCASGITMFRVAPLTGFYYGTDLSEVIIEKNKEQAKRDGHTNIKLRAMRADEIGELDEKDFDLIIINSVIQCFGSHNYLRDVLKQTMGLMADKAYLFVGDVMDGEKKQELVNRLTAFKYDRSNRDKNYATKTDFSAELFLYKDFWRDLSVEWPEIQGAEFSDKIFTVNNELTDFRYDVMIQIDKTVSKQPGGMRKKYRDDFRILERIRNQLRKRELDIYPGGTAYIIYTSGTTGRPKGVAVSHNALTNLCSWHNRRFQVTVRDHAFQYAGFGFDASVWEFFPYILSGATVHVLPNSIRLDLEALNQYFHSRDMTIGFLPTQLCEQFMELENTSLRILLTGGDKLRTFTPCKYDLYNNYGPTENAVVATSYKVSSRMDNIPIGGPIDNNRIYILNGKGMQLQPIGVSGELYIAGASIANGYLNNPEQTAEKFLVVGGVDWSRNSMLHSICGRNSIPEKLYRASDVKHEGTSFHAPIHSVTLYKTGDLGRYLPDGCIEFLGRMDTQVKVRGYRIETGEIEARLLEHPLVDEAVVEAYSGENDGGYLCGYVVAGEAFDTEELRGFLSIYLPAYMIPGYFVLMEKLPLTVGGKVDRGALPVPEFIGKEATYSAAATEMEKQLVTIWSDVLKVPASSFGIDDNFFDLGGHSLKATILSSRIHQGMDIKLPLAEVFNHQTVREMAAYMSGLSETAGGKYAEITPAEKRDYYALSSAQKRMFILQEMDVDNTGYNIPMMFPVSGDMNHERLEKAFNRLIARHESLRTRFQKVGGEPVQRILDRCPGIEIKYVPLGDRSGAGLFMREFTRPFDLNTAPLIRVCMGRFDDGEQVCFVDMHHIISDGTSHGILIKDFVEFYEGREPGDLRLQYTDFSQWQNRLVQQGEIKTQMDYWLGLYTDARAIPRLDLPTDYKRPEVFSFAGAWCGFVLDCEDAEGLKKLGAIRGGTLYMNILALLNILFYKYTGQCDIVIGSGIAGRPHADLQDIIGMFINMLAMRNFPAGSKTYGEFSEEVIARCIEAFDNQDVQFEELVDLLDIERDPSRNPLFDISLVVQNFQEGSSSGSVEPGAFRESSGNGTSKFDMTFMVREAGSSIVIDIEYYTEIFSRETMRGLTGHFRNLVKNVVRDPGCTLDNLDIMTMAEKARIVKEFNDTSVERERTGTIAEMFESTVRSTPDRIAMVWGEKALTYRELDRHANDIAVYLETVSCIRRAEPVGILLSPCFFRMASVMGILMAGGMYVPLDPALPRERLKYMIDDAGIKTVISEKQWIGVLNFLHWECKTMDRFLCVDSDDIDKEIETELGGLMDIDLWCHVGKTATDDIGGGGWVSSFTGDPLTREEMDEYGDNVLEKLSPILHDRMRVLEIGCASGITMFRIAPLAGFYLGTDLSDVIIDRNKILVKEKNLTNIKLETASAHEIPGIGERNFDLIIINSVIQCFPGYNYLRDVLGKCFDLLSPNGYVFVGDVMDLDKKKRLIEDLETFKYAEENQGKGYSTKMDFASELFVPKGFWKDFVKERDSIKEPDISGKNFTIKNELTEYRYDVLLQLKPASVRPEVKHGVVKRIRDTKKHRDDRRLLGGKDFERRILRRNKHFNSPAYVIYTSGSTGKPKGVMVNHGSLRNTVCWQRENFEITASDNSTMFASFGFDAVIMETFPYIISGSTIHILDGDEKLDPDWLNHYYESRDITISFLPTQVCELFMQKDNRSLRALLTGGDKLRVFTPRRYALYNNYGPTENTVVTTSFRVTRQNYNIPIGKPIHNNQIYIVNRNTLKFQPIGVVGELYISGAGIAGGYLNNQELTARYFNRNFHGLSGISTCRSVPETQMGDAINGCQFSSLESSQKNNKLDYCSPEGSFPEIEKDRKIETEKKVTQQNQVTHNKSFAGGPGGSFFKSAPLVAEGNLFYRTGDLGRWLVGGDIEFFGRADGQVKIRGYRIEVGEIESCLMGHWGVESAVVVEWCEGGDTFLCAYTVLAVSGEKLDFSLYLSQRLPSYMVPSFFMELESIPLTVNGKVDRKRLPKPGDLEKKDYTAPGDEMERRLVEIWAGILHIDSGVVGVEDNFFDLGGHSLKATVLAAKIHQEFNVKIMLGDIFKFPTVRGLAGIIKKADKDVYSAVEPVEERDYYPLSAAQRRLFLVDRVMPGSTAYNMPQAIPLDGTPDLGRLERVMKEMIARHESLRTSFALVDDQPVQRIHSVGAVSRDFRIEVLDAGQFKEENKRENKENNGAGEKIRELVVRSFDLTRAPLMRVVLVKLDSGQHLLFTDMHHIISDGVSMTVLAKEFRMLNSGGTLKPPRLAYKDFAMWQAREEHGETLNVQERFWLELLKERGELPVLMLPYDFGRPPVQVFEGNTVSFFIGGDDARGMKKLVEETGATLYMVLLGIFTVWLSRLGGGDDIIVGTPVAGRPHADLQDIIGMFVNTVCMRNYPEPGKTFMEFLLEVKKHTLEAFENQDYPFEELVEKVSPQRDAARNPIFDVTFNLLNQLEYNGSDENDLFGEYDENNENNENSKFNLDKNHDKNYKEDSTDSGNKRLTHVPGIAKFDLNMTAVELGSRLVFTIEYCSGLFLPGTIDRFIGYFKNMVSTLQREPGMVMGEVDILGPDEKKQLLLDFNGISEFKDKKYGNAKTVVQLFSDQAKRHQDVVALADNTDIQTTYGYLDALSGDLAARLARKGAKPGTIAALMMRPSVEMMVSILAVLKTGAAYLPLDPEAPEDRVRYILNDSGAGLIVDMDGLLSDKRLDGENALHIPFPSDLGGEPEKMEAFDASHLAYVIYTSGTTGKPKGVAVAHANLSPLLHWGYDRLGIGCGDRVMQNLSYYFDWSVWEIFISLTSGAALYTIPREMLLNPATCTGFIGSRAISVLHVTPTQARYYFETGESADSIRFLFLGAEKLSFDLAQASFEWVGNDCRVFNMYGPTEATIISAVYELSRNRAAEYKGDGAGSIPIGGTVGNNLLLVLDEYYRPCPQKVAGELYIAGEGVARGYLNRPELTAEKFGLAHGPQLTTLRKENETKNGCYFDVFLTSHERQTPVLYSTGDLVRWLPGGVVEFLGRKDHQVKIRGYRIETGEIEAALLEHDGVKETVVLEKTDLENEKQLCAYVVQTKENNKGEPVTSGELKEFLGRTLPVYMVPAFFVFVEDMPMTPNGKLDRKALPEPAFDKSRDFVLPSGPVEQELAAIWAELLGIPIDQIGANANFFDLGGHSLKATVLTARIHKSFNVKLTLADVFVYQTVRELALFIGEAREDVYTGIEPAEEKEFYALSPAQKRIYFIQQLDPASVAYNMPQYKVIDGALDPGQLENAVERLIERHESFRTSFHLINNRPVQRIHKQVIPPRLERYDWDEGKLKGKETGKWVRPFDLTSAPLVRMALIRAGEQLILFTDMHHIVSDGVSMTILEEDITACVSGERLKTPALRYRDYSEWLNSEAQKERVKSQEDYWLNRFQGDIPVMDLPLDFPRPVTRSAEGGSIRFGLEAMEMDMLASAAPDPDITSYMLVLAVFNVLLAHISGQRDIVVGTPVAARRHADLQNIIGMFVNTLALRNEPAGNLTFMDFLKDVRRTTLDAMENQEYPFEELVDKLPIRRDTARNPLFDVMFSFQGLVGNVGEMTGTMNSGKGEDDGKTLEISKFDLTLNVIEKTKVNVSGKGGELLCHLTYCSALFKKETAQRFAAYFSRVAAVVGREPLIQIGAVEIITDEEKKEILYDFNDTTVSYPQEKTLIGMVEEYMIQTPDRLALAGIEEQGNDFVQLTYGVLNEKASGLAAVLMENGVNKGDIIPILLERRVEMVIAILGIMKAGGVYLPMTTDMPGERIRFFLVDSAARVMVTSGKLEKEIEAIQVWEGTKVIIREVFHSPVANLINNSGGQGVFSEGYVESVRDGISGDPATTFVYSGHNQVAASDAAYVIYTSGTTGRPKGVLNEHGALVNIALWKASYTELTSNDHGTTYAPFAFDASVLEIFLYLVNGAVLFVIREDMRLDLPVLNQYYERHGITVSFLPTGICEAFMQYDNRSLRALMTGGDKLRKYIPRRYKLFNNYGPTETAVAASVHEVIKQETNIPIGKPAFNVHIYILSRGWYHVQPVGIAGEMFIGGKGISRGYLNNPELTASVFLDTDKLRLLTQTSTEETAIKAASPLVAVGNLLYKTGDLGRWRDSGDIEFLGRVDRQVKIRGNRIEIEGIESRLREFPEVGDVVVVLREESGGGTCLCAYITMSDGREELPDFRGWLQRLLPQYMIPAHFIRLESIPLTRNGKLDRGALPEPEFSDGSRYVAPRTGLERKLVEAWNVVLGIGVDKIGVQEDFFEIGGDSIKAVSAVAEVNKVCRLQLPVTEFFKHPTVEGLAAFIEAEGDRYRVDEAAVEEESGTDRDALELALREKVEEMKRAQKNRPTIQEKPDRAAKKIFKSYKKQLDGYRKRVEKEKLDDLSITRDYRHVLVAGATGFLGSYLVRELLERTGARISVLVRGKDEKNAAGRFREKLTFYFGESFYRANADRIEIVPADLSLDNFGIPGEQWAKLSSSVDAVVNSAADSRHFGEYDDFYNVNVRAVERMLEFCLEGKKKDFHHMSTISVGNGPIYIDGKDRILFTEECLDMGQASENPYADTKIKSERKVFQYREKGVNGSIYRLGNLVSDSVTGKAQQNIDDNWFFARVKTYIAMGVIPLEQGDNLRMTFIDHVARAAVLLMTREHLKNRVYHLSNPYPFGLGQLGEILQKQGVKIEAMDMIGFYEHLIENLSHPVLGTIARSFVLHSYVLDDPGKRTYGIYFLDRTLRILEKAGFRWTPVDEGHIKAMMDHVRSIGFLLESD